MRKVAALFSTLTILSFYGCTPTDCTPTTGVVENAKVEKIDSEIYSEEDINEAIDVIENYFEEHFDGCRLEKIAYAGDETTKREIQYRSENGRYYQELIVLVSDFYVYPKGGDGSLNTDYTYTDWNWILERSPNGNWEHKDHGYG